MPPPAIPPAVLRKQYRRTSLLYHPDKNPSPDAAATFHLLTTGFDILSDPTTKAAYDNARAASLARKRRAETLNVNRRAMKEELEERERSAKRARTDEAREEHEFRTKLEKLKQEGAMLRKKREEALRKAEIESDDDDDDDVDDGEKQNKAQLGVEQESRKAAANNADAAEAATREFSDLERTIRVRWNPKKVSVAHDQKTLHNMFMRFGKIADCVVTPDSSDATKQKKLRMALLVFEDVHAAAVAVADFAAAEFGGLKDVSWAAGQAPNGLVAEAPPKTPSISKQSTSDLNNKNTTPPTFSFSKRGTPRFTSFTAVGASSAATLKGSSSSNRSSSYENATLLRMREMEKKRLEEDIRSSEAEHENS